MISTFSPVKIYTFADGSKPSSSSHTPLKRIDGTFKCGLRWLRRCALMFAVLLPGYFISCIILIDCIITKIEPGSGASN
jgi:hypothetical protein